jgi:hypothetical protein
MEGGRTDSVQAHLRAVQQDFARRLDIEVAPDAQHFLDQMYDEAAQRLVDEGRESDPAALKQADAQLFEFLARVMRQGLQRRSRYRPARRQDAIRDDDILRTRAGLCPGFWPFC